jgi:hypothetical protein
MTGSAKIPEATKKNWIASSQELLAMTGRDFRFPLNVIASASEAIQRQTGKLAVSSLRIVPRQTLS